MPKQTFYNLDEEKQKRIFDAAVTEFSQRSYEVIKISNIIRDAKIPRGSFYQYFENKKDLFLYLLTVIGKQKLEFMGSDLLNNSDNEPFINLFKKMYTAGINFSLKYPEYIQIMRKVIASNDDLLTEMMVNNKQIALDIYIKLIDKDKIEGRIKEDICSETFAEMVFNMTLNVAVDQAKENNEFDFEKMYQKIDKIMNIFGKGISRGELDV